MQITSRRKRRSHLYRPPLGSDKPEPSAPTRADLQHGQIVYDTHTGRVGEVALVNEIEIFLQPLGTQAYVDFSVTWQARSRDLRAVPEEVIETLTVQRSEDNRHE